MGPTRAVRVLEVPSKDFSRTNADPYLMSWRLNEDSPLALAPSWTFRIESPVHQTAVLCFLLDQNTAWLSQRLCLFRAGSVSLLGWHPYLKKIILKY